MKSNFYVGAFNWKFYFIGAILLLSLIFAAILEYKNRQKAIVDSGYNQLSIAIHLRSKRILAWEEQQIKTANVLARCHFFSSALKQYLSGGQVKVKNELLMRCDTIRQIEGYINVSIVKTDGSVIMSINPRYFQLDTIAAGQIQRSILKKNAVIGPITNCKETDKLYLEVFSPILDPQGNILAVLILRQDYEREISPMLRGDSRFETDIETKLLQFNKGWTISGNGDKEGRSVQSKDIDTTHGIFKALRDNMPKYLGPGFDGNKIIAHIQPVKNTNWFLVDYSDYNLLSDKLKWFAKLESGIVFLILLLLLHIALTTYQFKQKKFYRNLHAAELALREEQENFRITLYSIGEGVITTDENGRIKQMNKAAENLTGWSEELSKGLNFHDVFCLCETGGKEDYKKLDFVFANGVKVYLDNSHVLCSKNNEKYGISCTGSPIRDSENNCTGAVFVFKDQTHELRIKRELQKSEAQLLKAERIANLFHWELNLRERIIYFSESNWIQPDSLKQMSVDGLKGLLTPEYCRQLEQSVKCLIDGGRILDETFKIRHPVTGSNIDIHILAEYDSEIQVIFGIVQDFTEISNTREQLLQANKELKKLNGAKDTLFSIIGHDLKNPIGNILGFSDLLLKVQTTNNQTDAQKFTNFITASARNALNLLDNLLYWAKIQTDKIYIDNKMADLRSVVAEVSQLLELSARIKNITINNVVQEMSVYFDENIVKTILRNLISNAIKFTDTNGRVDVYSEKKTDKVEIIVKDNGKGMDAETLNGLFTGSSAIIREGTSSERGSGLGLVLCSEFVRLIHGNIWANSEPGNGSEIHFTIPVKQE